MLKVGDTIVLAPCNDGTKDPSKYKAYRDSTLKDTGRMPFREFVVVDEVTRKHAKKLEEQGLPTTYKQWIKLHILDDTRESYNVGDKVTIQKIEYLSVINRQAYLGIFVEKEKFEY